MKVKPYQLEQIAKDLMSEFFSDCEVVPRLEVTFDPSFVAETRHYPDLGNCVVKINDYVLQDLETLIQVLLHELIHHTLYLKGISGDPHGEAFKTEAARLNGVLGESYIGTTGEETSWS